METRGPLEYGVSLTDACLGWGETEDLLNKMAHAVWRASERMKSA